MYKEVNYNGQRADTYDQKFLTVQYFLRLGNPTVRQWRMVEGTSSFGQPDRKDGVANDSTPIALWLRYSIKSR